MTSHFIRRGDTWKRTYNATQGGAPFDLSQITQAWLTFRIGKAKPGIDMDDSNAALQITLGDGITIYDAPSGVLRFVLTAAQTKTLVKSRYEWDLQFRLVDGTIDTPDSGQASIEGEVTVAT